jgi:hypothetical protein
MAWSEHKIFIQCTHPSFTLPSFGLDYANNSCTIRIVSRSGDLVTFLQMFDLLLCTIMHINCTVSMEATPTIIATIRIVIKLIHCLSKLLCILNDLLLCLLSKRSRGWVHTIVDIISIVGHIVEHISSKILEALFSKITFALHIERSDQVSKLVLAPFLDVFDLF